MDSGMPVKFCLPHALGIRNIVIERRENEGDGEGAFDIFLVLQSILLLSFLSST